MDLFSYQAEKNQEKMAPLAVRMRPGNLEEFVGQEHIIGENKLLSRLIRADQLQSLLFFGPPGTGKTSLAKLIANHTKAEFIQINATTVQRRIWEATAEKPYSLWTRFIALIRHSRIICFPMWKTEP